MAIGGSYNNKGNGSNGVGRGRSYGLMLLLAAFGAALLGVMVLHKLRERRIFKLLIKERDSELFSLNLLLQKERDYIKEVKGKNEEMKAKIFSLRTQKMELDRRHLEMQSTIDSLKDEQRTMEIAIEEKQNDIKMLRAQDRIDSEKENPQVVALVESLKQKEAEIEDLKHRLQYQESDPSNPQAKNITRAEEEGKSGSGEIARVEGEDGNKVGRENVENQGEDKNEGSKDENVSLSHNVVANSTGVISQNFAGKDVDGEEFRVEENGQLRKRKNSQVEGEANSGTDKGVMKMEIRDGFEKNGKRGFVGENVVKGRRWRLIAKSRRLENNGKLGGVTRTRNARFYRDDHGVLKRRVKRPASKGGVLRVEDNHQLEETKSGDASYEMPEKGGIFLNGDVMKESAKHGGDDELFDDSGSRSEGISNEEYKEEIDESEF